MSILLRMPKIRIFLLALFFCVLTIVLWINGGEPTTLETLEATALMQNTKTPRLRYNFLLVPAKQISEPDKASRTSIVMVKSAYDNKDRRDAIRATWGSLKRYRKWRLITVFLIGKPPPEKDNAMDRIQAEHERHQDILMLDVKDVAEHVPDKTLAGMQWVSDFVPRSWVYSSADDGMSLHVANFVRYLEDTISTKSPYVLEECEFQTLNLPLMCVYSYKSQDRPARDGKSKWYMSKDLYPPSYWPPYCRGGWYSMPVNLAGKLYETSRWMKYLHLDDVWITGLVRINYVATVQRERVSMNVLLDAAPLASRSDRQLNHNSKETASEVLVSHAWGNIETRKTNVAEILKENWRLWLPSFSPSEDGAL